MMKSTAIHTAGNFQSHVVPFQNMGKFYFSGHLLLVTDFPVGLLRLVEEWVSCSGGF